MAVCGLASLCLRTQAKPFQGALLSAADTHATPVDDLHRIEGQYGKLQLDKHCYAKQNVKDCMLKMQIYQKSLIKHHIRMLA